MVKFTPRQEAGTIIAMKFPLIWFGAGMLFLSAAVFFFTIFTNLDHGFWHDEVISLKFASPDFDFGESFRWWANSEPHPFTYYMFLRIWFMIVGFGEATAKLFNPIIFVICAILAYRIWPAERRAEFLLFLSLNMTSVWSIFYLIEVRSYGAMLSVSLVAASAIFALQHYSETGDGLPRKLWQPFSYLTACVILLALLDSWGVLLGSGIVVFVLLRFPMLRAQIMDKWLLFTVLTIVTGVAMLQYLNIVLIYDGLTSLGITLRNFTLDASSWQVIQIMVGELFHHIYVTGRSEIIVAVAALVWAGALVLNRRVPVAEILIYLGPVAFAYGVVLVLHAINGQAYYRHYSSLLLLPFLFLFLLSTAFRARGMQALPALAISLFVLANVASIPFFERFPDKPRHIGYVKVYQPVFR